MAVVVLYGPKAAGKSQVAEVLRARHAVAHVDADALVLDMLVAGVRPHLRHGWLFCIKRAVGAAMDTHAAVSVEATGAWASDWQLADDLEAAGDRVLRVWISAPLELTLDRLALRTTRKAPVTEDEARWIYTAACERARGRQFQLLLDTGQLGEDDLAGAVAPLVPLLRTEKRHRRP
jgi:shikimate kinase